MRNLRKFMLGILCVTIIGALIAGCGGSSDSPGPSPSSSVSPSPSTSSSPSPSASTSPSPSAAVITWASYNGSVLPSASTPAFTLNESVAGALVSTLNADGTITLDTSATATNKGDWRINNFLSATPSKMTLLFRAKANSTSYRAAEFDVQTGINGATGARIKFILRGDNNKLQIEKIDGTNSKADNTIDTSVYHIYQITYNFTSAATATVNVYIDGVLSNDLRDVAITQTSTSNCFLIGDGGGSGYSCNIDWVAWTLNGAYTPSQVTGTLPAGLGTTTGY